jgi:hypothetical protein
MKRCPQCQIIYSDHSFNFCLEDGKRLETIGPLHDPQAATLAETDTLELPVHAITPQDHVSNIRTVLSAEINYNLTKLRDLHNKAIYKQTHLTKEQEEAGKSIKWQVLEDIPLPLWRKVDWEKLLTQATVVLAAEEFSKIHQFYDLLDELTERNKSDAVFWTMGVMGLIYDLLRLGNPLEPKSEWLDYE